jgi:hypothetical protein
MKYIYLVILYALALAYTNVSNEVMLSKKNIANKTNSTNRLPASHTDDSFAAKIKKCFSY